MQVGLRAHQRGVDLLQTGTPVAAEGRGRGIMRERGRVMPPMMRRVEGFTGGRGAHVEVGTLAFLEWQWHHISSTTNVKSDSQTPLERQHLLQTHSGMKNTVALVKPPPWGQGSYSRVKLYMLKVCMYHGYSPVVFVRNR